MKKQLLILLISANAFAVSVCLDPGHGGSDPGASGPSYPEAAANLDVSNKAKNYLLMVSGVTVGMTRTSDVYVSLADRCTYANSGGYDRFMSQHENAFDATVQGTETYCHPTGSSNSFDLRNRVHPWLIWAHSYTDRGTKTADYYVLRNTTMPAILGEGTFIDYTAGWDESWRYATNYNDHEGRQGYAYCAGFCEHMSLTAPTYSPGGTTYEATWSAQSYMDTMTAGSTQIVWVEYNNTGTAIWKADSTYLTTSEPRGRESEFYTEGNWFSHSGASGVDYNTLSGSIGRFTFIMTAPAVAEPQTNTEHWALYDFRYGYFGPPDSQVYFRITVYPTGWTAGDTIIVDNGDPGYNEIGTWNNGSSPGGWLDDYRWANTGGTEDRAIFNPGLSAATSVDIWIWYVEGGNRANNTAIIVHAQDGDDTVHINQIVGGVTWRHIGAYTLAAGATVEISDIGAEVSKVIIADAVKFVRLMPLGISENKMPKSIEISAYPNPFNSSCEIRVQGFEDSRFQGIEIFDLLGKSVWQVSLSEQNGSDLNGRRRQNGQGGALWHPDETLGSGVYLIRVKAGEEVFEKRIVYLK